MFEISRHLCFYSVNALDAEIKSKQKQILAPKTNDFAV